MGSFLHRNEHDIGNPEPAHKNGESPDDGASNVQYLEQAFKRFRKDADLVERKVVIRPWLQSSDAPHNAAQFVFQFGSGNPGLAFHHDQWVGPLSVYPHHLPGIVDRHQQLVVYRIAENTLTFNPEYSDHGEFALEHLQWVW